MTKAKALNVVTLKVCISGILYTSPVLSVIGELKWAALKLRFHTNIKAIDSKLVSNAAGGELYGIIITLEAQFWP